MFIIKSLRLISVHFWTYTHVWSPEQVSLKTQIEMVQRKTTGWILQQRVGEMSCRNKLLALKSLPLTCDRELKDLVFFFKCLNGFTDL